MHGGVDPAASEFGGTDGLESSCALLFAQPLGQYAELGDRGPMPHKVTGCLEASLPPNAPKGGTRPRV